MGLLKKENWFGCLILNIITGGIFNMVLASFLDCYDKDEWYAKWQNWVLGTACLLFPVFIMLFVFIIEINCKVACKLKVPGEKVYNIPYSWILCFIVPIIGWVLLIVMLIYITIWPSVMIYNGKGEEYLSKKCK